eukprot:RCo026769
MRRTSPSSSETSPRHSRSCWSSAYSLRESAAPQKGLALALEWLTQSLSTVNSKPVRRPCGFGCVNVCRMEIRHLLMFNTNRTTSVVVQGTEDPGYRRACFYEWHSASFSFYFQNAAARTIVLRGVGTRFLRFRGRPTAR